jgi:hypothetical protein
VPAIEDAASMAMRPICIGEPPTSTTVVEIAEPNRELAVRNVVLALAQASEAHTIRNTVRDIDRPGTLKKDFPDRVDLDRFVRNLLADGTLEQTDRGLSTPRTPKATPGSTACVDPLAIVSKDMPNASIDTIMASALHLWNVLQRIATRQHRDENGHWISCTVTDQAAPWMDGLRLRRIWYRIDHRGVLHVPQEEAARRIPLETPIIWTASGRAGRDPVTIDATSAVLRNTDFGAALRKTHPPSKRLPRHATIDPDIGEAIRNVCVFSSTAYPSFDQTIVETALMATHRSDMTRMQHADSPRYVKDADDCHHTDVYHWLTPPDEQAAKRRMQAIRIGVFSLSELMRSTKDIDAGRSVVEILCAASSSTLPAHQFGRILSAYPYPFTATDEDEREGMPHIDGNRPEVQVYKDEVLCDVVDLCSCLGGTEILRHGPRAVRRLATWIPTLSGDRSKVARKGRYVVLGNNFLRSAARDPDTASDMIEMDVFDFVKDFHRRLAEAWDLEAARTGSSRRPPRYSAVVDLLVGPDGGLGRLRDASVAWHKATNGISRALEGLRNADVGAVAPTANPLSVANGTVTWLIDPASLIREGSELSHCVGSYADRVAAQRSFIASVVASDGSRATLELGRRGGNSVPPTYQFRTLRNDRPRSCTSRSSSDRSSGGIHPSGPRDRLRCSLRRRTRTRSSPCTTTSCRTT